MINPVKILIIDDEVLGRELLEAILIPENYSLLFAENGKQGLELASSKSPDLILCDVMMPAMDGFEVCRRIRQDDKTRHIPIFLITALDDRDSKIQGIDAGADDYISKPFDRLEILAKIKNSLARIKSIEQNKIEAEPQIFNKSNIKTELLEALANSFSDDIKEYTNIELFRSSKIVESKHLFSVKKYPDRIFYFFVSNTLDSVDAVIINCILINILHQILAENTLNISEIIKRGLARFNLEYTPIESDVELKTKILIVAIMQNTKENTIICSGNNPTLILISENNTSDSDSNTNYQPFYISNTQDFYLKKSNKIILVSPNIMTQTDPSDLCTYVNEEFDKDGEERITSKIPEKFNLTQDVLVVKLTF